MLSNSEKIAIVINVIYTNRNGEKKQIRMNLRHYLQAKKVRPALYEPADDEAKKIVAKIPMDLVPAGTTQTDVDNFERTKGTIKGRKVGKFDLLMDAIEKGLEVDEILSPRMMDSLTPIDNVPAPQQESPEDILNELNKNKPTVRPVVKKEATAEAQYSKDELGLMDAEQLNKLIVDLPGIAKKMKEQLMKVKDKSDKIDQLHRLLVTAAAKKK